MKGTYRLASLPGFVFHVVRSVPTDVLYGPGERVVLIDGSAPSVIMAILAAIRACRALAIPIVDQFHHPSDNIPPSCTATIDRSPAEVATTHDPSPSAAADDTHTLNRASNAR